MEDSGDNSSSIDNALLESLFYNEMMFLDEPEPPTTEAAAETALLQDFGVTAGDVAPSAEGSSIPPFPEPLPQAEDPKLVAQFATLASRLGINLPSDLVQSLREGQSVELPDTAQSTDDSKQAASSSTNQHQKRPAPASSAAATKRRKKPRLVDCERQLADLKAENERLKLHLTNMRSQSHKLDQEREEAEQRMRTMLQVGAEPQELDAVVKEYAELYSDYGRRRQQEMTFHLEQLQRLANPTNFTKMGLWTLADQSRDPKKNPIASILQQELEITGQQGRRILEQREKIRGVCNNLKEVGVEVSRSIVVGSGNSLFVRAL